MKTTANSVYLWSIYGCALVLPIAAKLAPVFLVLMLLSWLFSGMPRQIYSSWKELTRGSKWLMMTWPFYFILHLLGVIHSEDMAFAGLDLGIKVWLFILPLMLMLKRLSESLRNTVFKLFVISTIVSFFYNVSLSWLSYINTGDSAQFLGQEFSHTMHIAYYGVCLLVSLMILVHHALQNSADLRGIPLLVIILFMVICVTGIFITGSKMTFLMLIVFVCLALIQVMRKIQNKHIAWSALAGVFLLFSGLYFGTDRLSERMDTMVQRTFYSELEPQSMESTMCRRMTWDATLDLIEAHPLVGTGTGDIKNELISIYAQKGYVGPKEARLNSHSQFLQSFAALGLFGFLSMFVALALMGMKAFSNRDFLALSFAVCMAMALMTESMLERQTGVLLMAFFYPLMATRFRT